MGRIVWAVILALVLYWRNRNPAAPLPHGFWHNGVRLG